MKRFTGNIIILILLAFSLIEGLQTIYPVIKVKPLAGVVNMPAKPVLNKSGWISGKFQDNFNNYLDYTFGFRPWFIRLYNQLQYSLYRKTKSKDIVIGKAGYIFEKPYIKAYLGQNFIGEDKLHSNVKNLLRIHDSLQNHNTQLLILLAPNKAWFYPDKIPGYLKKRENPSNYSIYHKLLKSTDIQVLDVNSWFLQARDTSRFPLIPKTGIHWTQYGADLVADSLLNRLSVIYGKSMCSLTFSGIESNQYPRGTDHDLGEMLNLAFTVKEFPYAYHEKVRATCDSGAFKPSAIFIGDSFFWNVFKKEFNNCFSDIKFWYYFSSEYDINGETGRKVKTLATVDEIESRDLVVLFTTAAYVEDPGFGFIDDFLADFNRNKINSMIDTYSMQIKSDSAWLDMVRQKAIERNIPLDSMIWMDAKYMAEQELKKDN